ncbi:FAD-binding protein, partial [Nonomuraea fuscirosea]
MSLARPDSLARELAPILSGDVRDDPYTRHLYSSDASMYAIEPLAVAFPRHADDVQALVAACGELGVPVLPRGAGTSLAGQTVGAAAGVRGAGLLWLWWWGRARATVRPHRRTRIL